jgi:peroxiredoxin
MSFWRKSMATLTTGTQAPDFTLRTVEGDTISLRGTLSRAPVVLAFFKVSCPTCQYTFPFLERIHQAYAGFQILGVSQNNSKDTAAFIKEFGITFPLMLDDKRTYPVSNAYGLTNVPSTFWIGQDGAVELAIVGWEKREVEEINRKAAESVHQAATPVFHPDESIAAFRAG